MNNTFKNAVGALSIALLLPVFAAAELPQQTKARKDAIQVTRSIETTTRAIHKQADELVAAQRNNHGNQTQKIRLQRIADSINGQLKPAFDRLAELQPDLPEWHQTAIDQMRSSAASLAANTNAAILNRNASTQGHPVVLDPEYGQLVANMTSQAGALIQVADATSDYGSAQLKGHSAGLPITAHN